MFHYNGYKSYNSLHSLQDLNQKRVHVHLTLKVLVAAIDALALLNRMIAAQWKGMGDVRSARYEPALLPPSPTIRVLCNSNCQRSIHSSSRAWQFMCYSNSMSRNINFFNLCPSHTCWPQSVYYFRFYLVSGACLALAKTYCTSKEIGLRLSKAPQRE